MGNRKLSRVFPLSTPPIMDGVYRVIHAKAPRGVRYSKWQFGEWHLVTDSVAGAALRSARSSDMYAGVYAGWRGLADKP